MTKEEMKEAISITSNDGVVYEFNKPKFECELLKVVEDIIIGWYLHSNIVYACSWKLDGTDLSSHEKHLTPIKKQWFDYPENFPCIISNNDFTKSKVIMHKNYEQSGWINLLSHGWRLATKYEIASLYYKDKL